jgi:uncharacterized protein (TIGR02300 family)
MPKPEWGVKRTCPHCETRFYDLQKEPIVCPECGTTYDVDSYGKVSAARERRAAVPVGADQEDLVDEEDVAADEEGDEDEALLGDEEEDEDEKATGPALSDEDEEGEDDAFKDAGIIDDEENEEEDEDDIDLDDDDDDIDLDEIPDDKH